MWNEPTDDELKKLPRLYETEKTPWEDKIIHMHFFLGGCDWYLTEYDPVKRLFFGFAILNSDLQNAEWGYISFDELRRLKTTIGIEVDFDLYWEARRAGEIENIAVAWQGRLGSGCEF